MKISLNWLQDFVTLRVTDPQEIGRRVTAGVAEVDDVEIQGQLLGHCCVGKVLSVRKHPNADKLRLCEVQTDNGVRNVVCGGSNLRVGMRVAFAHIGATVRWHGTEMMTLARVKIRGEESEGMICAASELDLQSRFPASDEHMIIDLGDGDEGVGQSLKEFLGLDDIVLHIDNHAITHRADLFSHIGFAREFVALGLAKWKTDPSSGSGGKRNMKFPKDALPFKTIVDRKDLIPRYASCLLTIEGLGETPKWMRKRLEATGWRCVSLPVDITNYVAMETGMPLHSFDADDIRGDVRMRTAQAGETIVTLDGVERVLPEGAIVLSDDGGIFDLLGIMGGLRSSTKASTKNIYLHAAILDPVSIRRAIIATGHRTDASTTYEKGVPREAATRGLLRAIELFLDLVPGASVTSRLEEWGDEGKAKPITLPLAHVTSVLGTEIPEKKMISILEDLEFAVKKKGKDLIVTPPLHRLGDIRGPRDLIEEIGRVAGYNEIPAGMPKADMHVPYRDHRAHRIRAALAVEEFQELVPLSLVGDTLLQQSGFDSASAVSIKNPLGEEYKFLQPSLLPPLLEHAQRNMLHAGSALKTFSVGHVFSRPSEEHPELCALYADHYGHKGLLLEPFLLLKQSLTNAFQQIGYSLEVAASGASASYVHPGRSAELFLRRDEVTPHARVGTLFEIHPNVAKAFDLPARVAACLIDMQAVLSLPPNTTIAKPLSTFPAVQYDVTIPYRITEQAGELLKRLRGSDPLLETVDIKDLYAGNEEKDSYNLTLTFRYRAKDRTLTEEEAKRVHEKVLQQIA